MTGFNFICLATNLHETERKDKITFLFMETFKCMKGVIVDLSTKLFYLFRKYALFTNYLEMSHW